MKKKICLITNWYPKPENPFQGLFFREQSIALSEYFDFVVLHHEKSESFSYSRAHLEFIKAEYNITEYTAHICYNKFKKKIYGCIRHRLKIANFEKNYNDSLFKKICKYLEKEKIDIFYTISGQTEGALVSRFARYFRKPYVISEHAPVPWPGLSLKQENKEAIENANLFFAISTDKIRQLMMQGVIMPKISYVGNMVDECRFTLSPKKNGIKTFITVGSHVFFKNYPLLIQAFNTLVKITDVPFKLMIVGYSADKGYSRDPDKLEKAIMDSDFAGYVDFIPSVPHEQMPSLFSKADAFVMTSIQEGQPVSAIEAGCSGLPIFATRCGGVEDYVDNDIGRISNVLDAEALACNLKDFLEERIIFDSSLIRSHVSGLFGKEAFVKNMVAAFKSVSNE